MPFHPLTESFTVNELLEESVAQYKNKTAFIDGELRLSYEEIDLLSVRLAKHFLSLGLQKGDVLAVQLPNSWEFVVAQLAAARVGIVFNPLSPNYRKKELSYMLSHCHTKAFITTQKWKGFRHEQLAYDVKKDLPDLQHVIVTKDKEYGESIDFSSMLYKDPDNIVTSDVTESAPCEDDPAVIMFTSGTESNPKAVLHTCRTFIPTHLINGKEYQINEGDTILSLTPLCHMFSLPMTLISLRYGATHYLYDEYQTNEILDILQAEKVSFLIAAPAHLIDILHNLDKEKVENINLRLILTGGTKIPSQMVKDLRQQLNCDVGAQWGMTEVCAGTFTRPGDEESLTWETVGRVTPNGEVIILDDRDQILPAFNTGQIAFKGNCLFIEYMNNSEATNEAFSEDGYFYTGDQGWLDDKGYLHFVGRTKDTINRGGLKYHASEVEEVLQMHPKIRQVSIVSVPDSRLGERGCAYISLRDNETFDFAEMQEFLSDKEFAKYKIPEYLEVWDELPTTPSGKISKGPIRKAAQQLES
ncbi:AMP-dependent synthetase [Salibacterium salarium]|uniref:AMP-dependent synthetase n=1 Tax=Salibacterium salarium TaxID=284579 RepID=A0A3R9Q2Q9_9BACI|nr:class I adenylate-forming enzyme family protein [Salibacterium salarium]RSL32334.1 AMP-dependent synthetase [Salibacterium salarium]